MLIIADVHLGKATHFRKHGIAIPKDVSIQNFRDLDEVIHFFTPSKICFLGDLFHSHINSEWQLFENWAKGVQAALYLISGNHDIIPEERYETLGVVVVDTMKMDTVVLTHHPEGHEGLLNICGHIHPGIRLKGKGKQSLTLACFVETAEQLVLPAFGGFTGKYLIRPKAEDSIHAIVGKKVVPLSK